MTPSVYIPRGSSLSDGRQCYSLECDRWLDVEGVSVDALDWFAGAARLAISFPEIGVETGRFLAVAAEPIAEKRVRVDFVRIAT